MERNKTAEKLIYEIDKKWKVILNKMTNILICFKNEASKNSVRGR